MVMNTGRAPIQGLWIGKAGMLEKLSMASFLAHGHAYHLYVYEKQDGLPHGVEQRDANEILPADRIFYYQHGQAKGGLSGFANLFRYALLAQKGGWWCDTDIICLKPFDFTDDIVMASERHWLWPDKICNAVIHCPPGHALMTACYEDAERCDPRTLKFAGNGEPLLRHNVKKLGLKRYIQPPDVFNPIDWYRSKHIIESGSASSLPATSYAVHCFRETWRWRLKERQSDEFRNHVFAADTLLGSLQRRYLPEYVAACS